MTALQPEAELVVRECVRREMNDTIGYELPLLDAYIALAAATLVPTSQLMAMGIRATPKDTYPVAINEVNRQRAKRLSKYFLDEVPKDRFYLLCLAKGYDHTLPLDPPWIDEAMVLAIAAEVENPATAGLISKIKGKNTLIRNEMLDARWAKDQPQLPKADFTPNRLEGTPVLKMPQDTEKPIQRRLL